MHLLYVFCSHLSFIEWLQNHLLACPFKKLTGIDCPGCGFQRSVLALMQGHLKDSLHLYPATIPLLLTAAYVLPDRKFHYDQRDTVKKILFYITGAIIIIAYLVKMV
ncbi:MAG TPA: DUF2752 domain-containing protein [Mucilaginibacter sp.]|jgi:hypothetical protein|nr:DUF2752 domain-containing protein [Mucilaginibacter sp.]